MKIGIPKKPSGKPLASLLKSRAAVFLSRHWVEKSKAQVSDTSSRDSLFGNK